MNKFLKYLILSSFIFVILPSLAYKVYDSKSYRYENSNNDKILFLLDFSNSMGEYLNHKTKVEQVKTLMKHVLPQISNNTEVGLRVYGHNCNLLSYNACRSSSLLVPIGLNTGREINSTLVKLRPRGMTPITYSLKQAVKKDFQGHSGNKRIILLTDGGENCDESPCDYSIALVKTRQDVKIDVIAFDVQNSEDLDQLKCTADVTGGRYIEAKTEAQLMNSMSNLIIPQKEVGAEIFNINK